MTEIQNKKPFARIVQHLSWIISGKGYGAILSLVYLAIATRSLGPSGYGAFALILGTTATLQLMLSFNIWQVLVKYGHEHIHAQNYPALIRLIRFCTAIDLGTAAAGVAIMGVVLWLSNALLRIDDDLVWMTFGYAAATMFSIRNVPRGILRLEHQFHITFVAEAVVPTVRLAGALLALTIQPTLGMFLFAWAGGELLSTLLFWWFAWRTSRRNYGRPFAGPTLRAWRENTGLPSMLVASNLGDTAYAVGQQLPILLVGSFAGVAEAGLYRLAHQLTQTITILGGFIQLASYTEMTHVYAKEGLRKIVSMFTKLTLIAIGLSAAIVLMIFLLGQPLLLFMSGPKFMGAYPFMLVLGLAACLQIVTVSCEPMLLAVGRSRTLIGIRLAGTTVLLAALYFMLHGMGAIGAGWARVTAEVVTLGLMFGACFLILRHSRVAA